MKKKKIYLVFGVFLLVFFSHMLGASEIISNRYVVVFKDQQLSDEAKFIINQSGESVRSAAERLINEVSQNQLLIQNSSGIKSSITNQLGVVYEYALKGFSVQLTPEAVTYLNNSPEIDYVIADQKTELHTVQVSPPSWGLDRIDQKVLPLDQSYEYFADGSAVHTYIVDTGIRSTHNEFIGRVGNGYDTIDSDNNPADCNGHGTHVAGTVAGAHYGVTKNAVIHPVRVFGCGSSGSFSDVIEGINWILANLQLPAVANMSLGDNATNVLSGTSMSAPHVAGVAALFLERNITSTPAQVAHAIMTDATPTQISNAGNNTPNKLLYTKLTTVGPIGSFEHWSNHHQKRGATNHYSHYFADVNGDGLSDWIQVSKTTHNGWVGLATGAGHFQHWSNHHQKRGATNNYSHYFADVNGDGMADWIQVSKDSHNGWVSLAR